MVRNVWVWLVFDGGLEDQPTVLGVWPEECDWYEEEASNVGLQELLCAESSWWDWMIGITGGSGT